MASPEYPDLPFIRPRSYTPGRPAAQPTLLVVHYTAGSEGPTAAEDGAAYDARRADGTSCHFFVDRDSTIQCVLTTDTAHSAYPQGNRRGVHYELCGTAQSRQQWLDAASLPTIDRCARQMVRDATRHRIPLVRVTPAQMRAGAAGICGHGDVTAAWGEGDHTDPGGGFPWDVLMERVARYGGSVDLTGTTTSISAGKGSDMVSFIRWDKNPAIFLTDGVTSRYVGSDGEMADIRTLGGEGTIQLGNGGNVRTVGRKELLGQIVGPRPAGWDPDPELKAIDLKLENIAAAQGRLLTTDQINAIGQQVSAAVVSAHQNLSDADQPVIKAAVMDGVRAVLHGA